jgi:cytochrome c
MKRVMSAVLVALFAFCFAGFSTAAEKATKEECVAKCKEAAQLVKDQGLEAALKQVNDKNGPFVWKDTYVFALDLNKTCNIAHPIKPKLIGKNLMAAKDANGKLFFAEFINVAKNKGEGWVSYMWPKPGEKKPSPKIAYVYKVPGEDVAMLAGIYE